MSKVNGIVCQCCLKLLNPKESRIQTTNKTREIFHNFIGSALLAGIICGKCNINLLTFDAFQKEIKRKHEELNVKVKEEPEQEDELIEGIIFEEETPMEEEAVDPAVLEPIQTLTEQPQASTSTSENDDDENDVIEIPQEPQVPIDLDTISDEPKEPKEKGPQDVIFKCDHCTAVSGKKEVIVQHIKNSHTFKCEQCKKVYPNMERLNSHIMRVHNVAQGNKRKQSLKPLVNEEQLRFRLKAKPYGRPWPSVLAKRKEEWGF